MMPKTVVIPLTWVLMPSESFDQVQFSFNDPLLHSVKRSQRKKSVGAMSDRDEELTTHLPHARLAGNFKK
jgi:hypothetical protein